MSDAPERIWAEPPDVFEGMGFWRSACEGIGVEYLRADLAARREADAYRAGLEAAATAAHQAWLDGVPIAEIPAAIRAMKDDTP